MIKYLSFTIALILFETCSGDRISSIEKIVDERNYTVEVGFDGCFGSGTERIDIKKDGSKYLAIYSYLDYSKPDGPRRKKKVISWDQKKDRQVKEVFRVGITLCDTLLHCTMLASYKLKAFPHEITFDDPSCMLTEKFETLIR